MAPEILFVGHVVRDVAAGGWRPGGGVTYGAAQASKLGLDVAVVTSCASELRPAAFVLQVAWHVLAAAETTCFENLYAGDTRRQRLLAHAGSIGLDDIPRAWRQAPLILLVPVMQEIDPALPGLLRSEQTFLAVGAQGWLRRAVDGRVEAAKVETEAAWLNAAAAFVSEEDLHGEGVVDVLRQRVPLVILTRAQRGCTVWDRDDRYDVPAFPVEEVDPTGAGDVFMTAFLVRYREAGDSREAAQFASAAAALSVTQPGLAGIAGRDEIEALLRQREAVGR